MALVELDGEQSAGGIVIVVVGGKTFQQITRGVEGSEALGAACGHGGGCGCGEEVEAARASGSLHWCLTVCCCRFRYTPSASDRARASAAQGRGEAGKGKRCGGLREAEGRGGRCPCSRGGAGQGEPGRTARMRSAVGAGWWNEGANKQIKTEVQTQNKLW